MIVIAGSPRKGMYSDRIAERFAGLTDSEIIYARNLRIGPCRACGYCKGAGNGTCVQKDDMAEILKKIEDAFVAAFHVDGSRPGFAWRGDF